jgi:Conserved TM helix
MNLVPAVSLGDSVQEGLDAFFAFLPNLLAFVVILIVGYFVAKIIKVAVTKGLQSLGMDKALRESDAGKYVERVTPGASPASGVGRVVFYLVFAFFLFSAIGALRIPALTTFMNEVLAYLPNVIAAIVIFVIAAALAGAVGGGVAKLMGDTPTGKVVGTVAPAIILTIAFFMVLEQLNIAPEIVRIAFAATMGALALGLALAFGLGGRDVAGRMLEDAYQKGRENEDQVKRDMETAKERGEERAEEAKTQVEGGGPQAPPRAPTGPGYSTA